MRTVLLVSIALLFASWPCLADTAKKSVSNPEPAVASPAESAALPYPPAQTAQENAGTPDSHQEAQRDQRGTETSPLAVKLLNTGQSDTEAAEQANRVRQKDEDDRWSANWTIGLTGALVFATILQFGALFYQGYWLRRSVVVAERTLDELERPWVFIHLHPETYTDSDNRSEPVYVKFDVANYGRLPATIKECRAGVIISDEPTDPPIRIEVRNVIGPDKIRENWRAYFPEGFNNFGTAFNTGDGRPFSIPYAQGSEEVFFCIKIVYIGISAKERVSAFCWYWNSEHVCWVQVDDTEFNYQT